MMTNIYIGKGVECEGLEWKGQPREWRDSEFGENLGTEVWKGVRKYWLSSLWPFVGDDRSGITEIYDYDYDYDYLNFYSFIQIHS